MSVCPSVDSTMSNITFLSYSLSGIYYTLYIGISIMTKAFNIAKYTSIALAATLYSPTLVNAADLANGEPEIEAPLSANPYYLSIFAGAVFPTDDVDYTNGQTVVNVDLDTGYTIGAALGKRFTEHSRDGFTPRLELAFRYAENDVGALNFSGNGPAQEVVIGDSQVSYTTFGVNGFIDADDAFGDGITPYLGGGVGVALVNQNIVYNAAGLNLNDDDTVFTWNVTAGVNFELNEQVSLFTDVGFHQLVDTSSLRRVAGAPAGGGSGPNGGIFEDDNNSIVARVGLSVSFDAFN